MKACCQRCGQLLPGKDDRFYPTCAACDDLEYDGARVLVWREKAVDASQTHAGTIPETARRNSWWTKSKVYTVPREQYAGN
jgi:hypothetical protein